MRMVMTAVGEDCDSLNRIAEGLGATGAKDADSKHAEAEARLVEYAAPQVRSYLDDTYLLESKRWHDRLWTVLAWTMTVIISIAAMGILQNYLPAERRIELLLIVPFFQIAFIFLPFFLLHPERIKGMTKLLVRYGEVEQAPFLVDALALEGYLPFSDTMGDIKRKLSELLPLYSQTDRPALSTRQTSLLARELTRQFRKVFKGDDVMTHEELDLLAAILIYFERELAQGRPTPKKVLPILRRFTRASPNDFLKTSDYTALKSAAAECLAYVGGRKA